MKIDIDVELLRQIKYLFEMRVRIGVHIGAAADRFAAVAQRCNQQFLGPGIVGQALLRHHAELEVDRPFVFLDERLHALEAAQADQRVDLDMRAHARRAVLDASFERLAGALEDVLDRHGVLDVRDPLHRVVDAAGLGRAAVDDARLVEMDVRLDQPAAAQTSFGIVRRGIADEIRLDRLREHPGVQGRLQGLETEVAAGASSPATAAALLLSSFLADDHSTG